MRCLPVLAIGLATIGLAAFSGGPAAAAGLTVVVDKLRSDRGTVHLALWNGAEGFTDAEHALIRTERPAAAGEVRFDLGRLPPGRYALASFHDENGDGELDRTWIGWPDEGLGFSNGAWIGLGPPSFEAAAFDVRPAAQVLVVALRYPEGRAKGGRTEAEPSNRSQ